MPVTGNTPAGLLRQVRALRHALPRIVGVEAVNHFKENFRKQGFDDLGVTPWAPRKGSSPRNKGRNLLIDSGRLRRSIRIVVANDQQVVVGTDVPYARAHNEGRRGYEYVSPHKRIAKKRSGAAGVRHNVRGHARKLNLPKRQFMGNSHSLDIRIYRAINARLRAIK